MSARNGRTEQQKGNTVHNTLARVDSTVDRKPGRLRRLRNRMVMLVAIVLAFLGLGGQAFAADTVDPSNPTGGLFDGAKTWMTTYGIPAIVGIVLVGSLFFLGLRWYQKGKTLGSH